MDLRSIRGVGPALSERLHHAGVHDVTDLAWVADLATLSDKTGIPAARLATLQADAVRLVAAQHRAPRAALLSVVSTLLDFGTEVGSAISQGIRRLRGRRASEPAR